MNQISAETSAQIPCPNPCPPIPWVNYIIENIPIEKCLGTILYGPYSMGKTSILYVFCILFYCMTDKKDILRPKNANKKWTVIITYCNFSAGGISSFIFLQPFLHWFWFIIFNLLLNNVFLRIHPSKSDGLMQLIVESSPSVQPFFLFPYSSLPFSSWLDYAESSEVSLKTVFSLYQNIWMIRLKWILLLKILKETLQFCS